MPHKKIDSLKDLFTFDETAKDFKVPSTGTGAYDPKAKQLIHDDFHSVNITEAVEAAQKNAYDHSAGVFTSRDGAGTVTTFNLEGRRDALEAAQEALEDAKGRGNSGKTLKYYEDRVKDARTALEKDYKGAVRAAEKSETAYTKVEKLFNDEHNTVIGELEKHHDEQMKAIQKAHGNDFTAVTKAQKEARERFTRMREAVDEHYKNKLEVHGEGREKLNEMFADIEEKTGLKAADYRRGTGTASKLEAAAGKEAGAMGKLGKMSTGSKVFVGALALVTLDGARRAVTNLTGGVNEQGQPTGANMGQVGVGVVEAGGALFGIHKLITGAGKMFSHGI